MKIGLFFLVLVIGTASANKHIRGIDPHLTQHYTGAGGVFRCLDGSKTVPFTRVNDNYCDCHDGRDEPGTSACAQGVFYCKNVGHEPKVLSSSFVDDGICDCCDGSDEPPKTCENTCLNVKKTQKLELVALLHAKEQALRTKATYATDLVERQKVSEALLSRADEQIAAQKEVIEKLEETARAVEAEERANTERSKNAEAERQAQGQGQEQVDGAQDAETAQEEETAEERARRVAAQWEKHEDSEAAPTEKVDEEAEQLEDGAYVDEDDEGEKRGVLSFFCELYDKIRSSIERLIYLWENGIREERLGDGGSSGAVPSTSPLLPQPSSSSSPQQPRPQRQGSAQKKRRGVGPRGEGPKTFDGKQRRKRRAARHAVQTPLTHEIFAQLADARQLLDELEKTKAEAKIFLVPGASASAVAAAENAENAAAQDFGPAGVFAYFAGKCFPVSQSSWTYNVCWYGASTQRDGGQFQVTVGHWSGFENNYTEAVFSNGDVCHGVGINRSLRLKLQCGDRNEVTRMEEPSTCSYVATMQTPAACTEEDVRTVWKAIAEIEQLEQKFVADLFEDTTGDLLPSPPPPPERATNGEL